MTQKQLVAKKEAATRGPVGLAMVLKKRANLVGTRRNRAKKAPRSADVRKGMPLANMKIADFYRPLKKPITLRLDADVLAWFKKDGRKYQTRINGALRKVMEREMKIAS